MDSRTGTLIFLALVVVSSGCIGNSADQGNTEDIGEDTERLQEDIDEQQNCTSITLQVETRESAILIRNTGTTGVSGVSVDYTTSSGSGSDTIESIGPGSNSVIETEDPVESATATVSGCPDLQETVQ